MQAASFYLKSDLFGCYFEFSDKLQLVAGFKVHDVGKYLVEEVL